MSAKITMSDEILVLAGQLTNDEIDEYNKIIITFNKHDKRDVRLGQAFYNMYYGIIFTEPFPELFYETDDKKAMEIISKCVIQYLLSKRYQK
jgi:hypothetical protein